MCRRFPTCASSAKSKGDDKNASRATHDATHDSVLTTMASMRRKSRPGAVNAVPECCANGHGVDSWRRILDGAQDPPDMDHVGMQATEDSRPVHRVYVDGFWMDETDVTNAQCAAFVKATGYVTVAERKPRAEDYPGAPPENLIAGSIGFHPVRWCHSTTTSSGGATLVARTGATPFSEQRHQGQRELSRRHRGTALAGDRQQRQAEVRAARW